MEMVLSISAFKYCIFDEMIWIDNKEKVENAGSKDESVSSKNRTEDENCEDTETKIGERNGEQTETDEAE
jgi:hypothetical protein